MPAANLVRRARQFLVSVVVQAREHGCANQRMRLHDNVLFFGQLAAFVEDFLVDAHFADIVERGRGHDDFAFMRREGIALRFADEGIQQHFRQQAEVAHVRAAFAVAGADNFADNFQHQAVAALLLLNLVAHLIA